MLGPGTSIDDAEAPELRTVWNGPLEVDLAAVSIPESKLRQRWRARQAGRATPLLMLVPFGPQVRVLGPNDAAGPVRTVDAERLVAMLREVWNLSRADAARSAAAALERLDEAAIPGVLVRGLLTQHVLVRRLRRSEDWVVLAERSRALRRDRGWRENLAVLGYRIDRSDRGYLLRADDRPVAVLHPYATPSTFSRTTDEGNLPEGLLVAHCRSVGARYGLLATNSRFRIYQAEASVGAATGRYLELDVVEMRNDDWPLAGLLAPESLKPNGMLDRLVEEARRFGNELQFKVEQRIRERVLPVLARAIGKQVREAGADLDDPAVRERVQDSVLTLLFRLLFLLYCEGRGYLPLSSEAYRPHALTTLVREARDAAATFDSRATTIWDRLQTLVRALRTGNRGWGVPAYDGDLFAPDALSGAALLEDQSLPDADFGPALVDLGFDPEADDPEAGIDYADLEVPHLGRIYEGLLALRLSLATEPLVYDPSIGRYMPAGRRRPDLQAGLLFYQSEAGGRKAGGVYYTPQVLVRHLVDHAVRPALRAHLARVGSEGSSRYAAEVLFDFRVVDPAMGSAHFLADALDVIADDIQDYLAANPISEVRAVLDQLRAEAGDERVSDGDLLRRVILKRCIYGVDLSPMAVEVAKITLWLTSFVPRLSLAYLGHNIKVGNALIGIADPDVMGEEFSLHLYADRSPLRLTLNRAAEIARRIAALSDRDPEEIQESRRLERELAETTQGLIRVFDMWCAEPFGVEGARDSCFASMEEVIDGKPQRRTLALMQRSIEEARRHRFFHWPSAFPEVFWRDRPGFDVVIGNPPWEELTVERLAFFALHDTGLRGLPSAAERDRRVAALARKYPSIPIEFEERQASTEAERSFFRRSGMYRLQGAGDPDLYKLFCERYGSLTKAAGWMGVVLPRSAFLTDGARGFRQWIFTETSIHRLDFLLNTGRWAFNSEPRYTIALVAAQRRRAVTDVGVPRTARSARVAAEPSLADEEPRLSITGPSESAEAFVRASGEPGVQLLLSDLAEWTRRNGEPGYEVPLLPSDASVAVFGKIRKGPSFSRGYPRVWQAFPIRELDETNDRNFFRHASGVPVWKGRSFDQYEPHGTEPAGFARETETLKRLQAKRKSRRSSFAGRFPESVLQDPSTHPFHRARVAFRDVTNRTNARTVIACLIPPRHFLTNKAPYLAFAEGNPRDEAFVLGVLNSLPFDWQARRLVETNLNFFILDLLCLPPPGRVDARAISERAARLSSVDERFEEFANECAVECGPLDDEQHGKLVAEIDALCCLAWSLDEIDLEVMFANYKPDWLPESQRERIRDALSRMRSR
jgi:hypothetical protein